MEASIECLACQMGTPLAGQRLNKLLEQNSHEEIRSEIFEGCAMLLDGFF